MEAHCKYFIFHNFDTCGVKMLREEMVSYLIFKCMNAPKRDVASGDASEDCGEY
jgi:hypothetical protein